MEQCRVGGPLHPGAPARVGGTYIPCARLRPHPGVGFRHGLGPTPSGHPLLHNTMSKFALPIPEMPPSTPDLFEDLSSELVRSAREQAMQALILADITRLPTPACQALTDAVWLGEWAADQPVAYPASPHAVAARRAWRNDMPMTASLLTHSGYLPHLDPLPEPDRSMISAHPAPEGWSHPDWEIAAAIYTLATTLRSGLRSWGDAPMAAEAAAARWGRRSTIAQAVLDTIATLPHHQSVIMSHGHNARWQTIVEGGLPREGRDDPLR